MEKVDCMDTCIEKAVGQNIRKQRLEKNLTQDEVAAKLQVMGCDLTRSAYAKIEVGQRHLYPDELILLKEVFGCSYEALLDVSLNS